MITPSLRQFPTVFQLELIWPNILKKNQTSRCRSLPPYRIHICLVKQQIFLIDLIMYWEKVVNVGLCVLEKYFPSVWEASQFTAGRDRRSSEGFTRSSVSARFSDGKYFCSTVIDLTLVIARGSRIFRLIPARIYFTRSEENLWWHAI
jgi:hypothetical protein